MYAKHILLGFLALHLKDHRRRGQKRIVSDFIELEKDPPLPGTHTLLIVVNVIQAQKELKQFSKRFKKHLVMDSDMLQ